MPVIIKKPTTTTQGVPQTNGHDKAGNIAPLAAVIKPNTTRFEHFIAAVIDAGDSKLFTEHPEIEAYGSFSGFDAALYAKVKEHLSAHGKLPSRETVAKEIGKPLPEVSEPPSYYLAELHPLHIRRALQRAVADANLHIKDDPAKSLAVIKTTVDKLEHITSPSTPSRLTWDCASDIESEPISWLWKDRLARGKITLIAGDPGMGKSQISLDIAARITCGSTWPDGGTVPQGNVLILSAEDASDDTIVPRLEAAKADRSRVHILKTARGEDGKNRTFSLQDDLEALTAKAVQLTAK